MPEDKVRKIELPRLDPKEVGLLVVDMQNGFCHPEGARAKAFGVDAIAMPRASIPNVVEIMRMARSAGVRITLTRPVHYKYVDRLRGELIRPLTIVPAVAINLSQPALVFTNAQPRKLDVVLHANMPKAQGELHLEADAGWTVQPAVLPFSMKADGEDAQESFTITPDHFGPETGAPAHFRVFATVGSAKIDAGQASMQGC